MYFLLSPGRYPRPDQDADELAHVPARLRGIVGRLLRADPFERYESAESLRRDLLECLADAAPTDRAEAEAPGGGGRRTGACGERGEGDGGPRIVVVGGLYAGCGSTFTALWLAQSLAELGVRVCAAEYPRVDPAMYDLLTAGRHPDDLRGMEPEPERGLMPYWEEGGVRWLPAHPYGASAARWDDRSAVDWAIGLPGEAAVIDVSTLWSDPGVEAICGVADLILLVACHEVRGWRRAAARQRLRLADRWQREGRKVAFAANRDVDFPGRREWLGSFPCPPAVILPNVDYAAWVRAEWLGKPVWRDPHLLRWTREGAVRLCLEAGIPLTRRADRRRREEKAAKVRQVL